MKSIFKINLYILAITVLLGVAGCKKVLDINTDPNNPSNANPEQVLPAAEVEVALSLGNDYAFVTSSWAQYWTNGTVVGANPIEFFTLQGSDIDRSYRNIYARGLNDLSVLMKGDQPIFAGMAKILTAYTMQMLVDLHGDLPYSEALKGEISDGAIVYPKFDKAEDIYAALIPLIDDGLTDIGKSGVINGITVREPGDEDLIYAGDLASWTAFANTLKLKILVRQSVANPAKLTEASTLLATGGPFIDESNPANVFFSGSTLGNSNPLWARFESRAATQMYYVASQTSLDVLDELTDPRVSRFYRAGTGGFIGINQGESNNTPYKATPNVGYASPSTDPAYGVYRASAPVILISSWESKFLQAEVYARTGDVANYESNLTAAVTASFVYLGLDPADATTYLAGRLDPGSAGVGLGTTLDERIRIIAIQKWISMNGLQMVEGWIETRRFDTPTEHIFTGPGGIFYSPSENSLGSDNFPSLMTYAQTETQYNPNTPSRVVTDKVFWDN
jgi:hypothetical protein